MPAILALLAGKKTYITAGLMIVHAAGQALGWWGSGDVDTHGIVREILEGLGLGTIRAGIKKGTGK